MNGPIDITVVNSDCNACNGEASIDLKSINLSSINLMKVTGSIKNGTASYSYIIPQPYLSTFTLKNLCPGDYTLFVERDTVQGPITYAIPFKVYENICPSLCCDITLTLDSWTDEFEGSPDGCCDCLPPPAIEPFPEPERVYQLPVKNYYQITDSKCDITTATKFAKGYWTLIERMKYGINRACTDIDLMKLWMKEQINQLASTENPDYICVEKPNPCFPTLPSDCPILVSGLGRTIITLKAGEDIGIGKVVYLGAGGLVYLNQPSNLTTYQKVLGFSTNAASTGLAVNIIVHGPLTIQGLSVGSIYYCIANGDITTVIPNTAGTISQQVGIATTTNTLIVEVQQGIII